MTQRTPFAGALVLLLSMSLPAPAAGNEEPTLRPRVRSDAFGLTALDGSEAVDRLRFVEGPPTSEKEVARKVLRSTGEGGGGDVLDLDVYQIEYSGAQGNVVLLIWDETVENPEGVNILEDGNLLGNVSGLPADQLPGTNSTTIPDRTLGVHTYRVEGGGTNAEASQEVVAAQPFADPSSVACATGAFRNPDSGTCEMAVTWAVEGTVPTIFSILVNDTYLGDVDGASRDVEIGGVPAGNQCVDVLGFLLTPQGNYRGSRVQSCCDIACDDTPCDPLGNLLICQAEFGPAPADNLLLVDWDNGELPYVAVDAFIDGNPAGTLPGDAEGAVAGNLSTGMHTIGLEGDCAANGRTPRLEESFDVLEATPHTNPISGPLVCEFDSGASTTVVTWTPADPSAFIDVFVTREPDTFYLGSIGGGETSVEITGTVETDVVSLQFFAFVNDFCYGSEIIACGESGGGVMYIQGVCNGVGSSPQITSAIFGLNFLFLGTGDVPPCAKACDSDGDGQFVITDMVRILNFLFGGGPAPSLWVDTNADGIGEPTCTQAAPEDDCATGHDACPL